MMPEGGERVLAYVKVRHPEIPEEVIIDTINAIHEWVEEQMNG